MFNGTVVTREERKVWKKYICLFVYCQNNSSIPHKPMRTGHNLLLCCYLILSKHPQYFMLQNYLAFRHSLQTILKKNWWINVSRVKDMEHLEM